MSGPAPNVDTGALAPVSQCWVCGGRQLTPYHEARFDFTPYADQDPELFAYTGRRVRLVRCATCGFGQPEALPTLPRFFDRMYDQRWADEWVVQEFDGDYKDFIFRSILGELATRIPTGRRRLLDVGAHAGRFLSLASDAGWEVEGIELNPKTAAYAARRTGAPVHQVNARELALGGRRFTAITLTDVLEHIPEPSALLADLAALIEPGGAIAVKVPCGRSQAIKERVLAAVTRHEVSLAGNLVHVNHFTPGSLGRLLGRVGFDAVDVRTGAPELPPSGGLFAKASNLARLAVYAAARLPGGVHTPLALNLQAYATWSGR